MALHNPEGMVVSLTDAINDGLWDSGNRATIMGFEI